MIPGREALAAAGWYEGRDVGVRAQLAALKALTLVEPVVGGAEWTLFPAAERALREFHDLHLPPAGSGRDVAATGCVVDPVAARHALRPFARLGRTTGSRLFPFGRTETGALLAVDEAERLFSVNHGGAWHHGETVREGLIALVEGHHPHRVQPLRWTWATSPAGRQNPLVHLVRTALVAVYVLHHHRVFSVRELALTVTTLRGVGLPVLEDRVVPLPGGSLDGSEAPLVAALEGLTSTLSVDSRSTETKLALTSPQGTADPFSSVSCTVRSGFSAASPEDVELALLAGAGASFGNALSVVASCAQDLADYTRRSPSGPVDGTR
ncbi:SUKH-3 domain-containing protein [Streptomyces sp. NPDC002490]|uniref:SUKH-3 domain-containing protein n=1 Tax=Streptomyces sp. NPDC002490 TaxID=3154416 RepID=UPI003326493E